MTQATKLKIELSGVPQTLLLPLYGRAMHSRDRHPFINDEEAIRVFNLLDFDLAKIKHLTLVETMCWAVRAWRFDNALQYYLKQHPDAMVVNLGAGLETAFSRNDNGHVNWLNLDLPDVISIREKLFVSHIRERSLAISIHDLSWLNSVERNKPTFFMAGGLFMYFNEKEVKEILMAIASHCDHAEIIFDGISVRGVNIANKMMARIGVSNALMYWGINDINKVVGWHEALHRIAYIPYFQGVKSRFLLANFKTFIQMLMMDMTKQASFFHLSIRR